MKPQQNLLIQNPAALTTTGATNKAAVAFYDFIFSKAGARNLARGSTSARPSLPSGPQKKAAFYAPTKLNTITGLGGWAQVTPKFFGPTGIITKAESANGYTS